MSVSRARKHRDLNVNDVNAVTDLEHPPQEPRPLTCMMIDAPLAIRYYARFDSRPGDTSLVAPIYVLKEGSALVDCKVGIQA